MNDTEEDDFPDVLVPIPGGPRFDLLIPDADLVDDLVDSLWRYGSAQDYPAPESEYPAHLQVKGINERRWSRYHEYTDQRSLTRDLNLDEPAVPGYRDFPTAIAKTINFQSPAMPSKSPKQARLMAAAAHNPTFAKRAGIPQKVAREFNQADAKAGTLKAKRSGK